MIIHDGGGLRSLGVTKSGGECAGSKSHLIFVCPNADCEQDRRARAQVFAFTEELHTHRSDTITDWNSPAARNTFIYHYSMGSGQLGCNCKPEVTRR